ncbi:MAG TPA: RsmD family RNA methyltransferase [Saprospiraceae bacterium]|nr:RsmD family RNA methyltransferase [Saprospiraceae bacterium]HPI05814.1 RsmD family RNA methyltransferase [Saprospiraceae bacterium]
MRIIGGKFKGRRFTPPADKWPTRPTTDFAKEGLFNILNNQIDFEDVKMLDLFGGTGSHGYEFVSRGCEDVTYVDKFPDAVRFVRKVVETLGIESQFKVIQMDVFKFIEHATGQYDYIFADPPYDLPTIDIIPNLIFEKNLLSEEGLFVLEHNQHQDFLEHPNLVDVRNYGKIIFSFFRPL